jgi:hypothetical protein
MTKLQNDLLDAINLQASKLEKALNTFSKQLIQARVFSDGTHENIIEARVLEQNLLLSELKKSKRHKISKSLIDKISAFCDSLKLSSSLVTHIVSYAETLPVVSELATSELSLLSEFSANLRRAHKKSIKNFHDIAKVLLLQGNIVKQEKEIKLNINRLENLSAFNADPASEEKYDAVMKDVNAMTNEQSRLYKRSIAGSILRIVGWTIIILATMIGLAPNTTILIMCISLGLTIVGGFINGVGIKLQTPPPATTQNFDLYNSLSFFKNPNPIAQHRLEMNDTTKLTEPLLSSNFKCSA